MTEQNCLLDLRQIQILIRRFDFHNTHLPSLHLWAPARLLNRVVIFPIRIHKGKQMQQAKSRRRTCCAATRIQGDETVFHIAAYPHLSAPTIAPPRGCIRVRKLARLGARCIPTTAMRPVESHPNHSRARLRIAKRIATPRIRENDNGARQSIRRCFTATLLAKALDRNRNLLYKAHYADRSSFRGVTERPTTAAPRSDQTGPKRGTHAVRDGS